MAEKQSVPRNMARLEKIVAALPESHRVDVEAWDDEPTFRVRNKNFLFTNKQGTRLGLKLSKEEAEAVVAGDDRVEPMGYGLGRHGWIGVHLPARSGAERWEEVTEWIRTSYTLVAPKRLAQHILDEDAAALAAGK
ncbi:MAG: MmcQ/YjbR family DNA-binding protein [Actinomycetota bacterium]